MSAHASPSDGNDDPQNQILVAAKTGNLDLLESLRDKACDDEAFRKKCFHCLHIYKSDDGLTCLHIAAERGDIEICRLLIEKVKIDVDFKTDKGDTPLLLAAFNGNFRAVGYFISQDADVNNCNYQGTTLLHIAAEHENIEMMRFLLKKGADIEAHSVLGTPLQIAASSARVESVRFLLSRNANPNAVSPFSDSPLVAAILGNSYELMEILLKDKAHPEKRSRQLTPLAAAARNNDTRFLKSLLGAGADPNIITPELLRPIEYAAEMRNTEGLTILLKVTDKITRYRDWSIPGIINKFHSEIGKAERKACQDAYIPLLDAVVEDAKENKDYSEVVDGLSLALCIRLDDRSYLMERCTYWGYLNEPNFALHDAEACFSQNPDAAAHHKLGAAWVLHKNYTKACTHHKNASILDPDNMEYKNSLSLSLKYAIIDYAERDLLKVVDILAVYVPLHEVFSVDLRDLIEKDPSKAMKVILEFLIKPDLPNFL